MRLHQYDVNILPLFYRKRIVLPKVFYLILKNRESMRLELMTHVLKT